MKGQQFRMGVIVCFSFEGIHSWPDAPGGPEDYLRHPHRHMFHVEAVKDVGHDNRDIEFIGLRAQMARYCSVQFGAPHTSSCEQMARRILTAFDLRSCRVFEDNENGAEVTVTDEVPIADISKVLYIFECSHGECGARVAATYRDVSAFGWLDLSTHGDPNKWLCPVHARGAKPA